MNRYIFIFKYNGGWMIVLYKDNLEYKYFNSAEDNWDNSLSYAEDFVGDLGNKYYYQLPSYDYVKDIDIFELENKSIESLNEYLK